MEHTNQKPCTTCNDQLPTAVSPVTAPHAHHGAPNMPMPNMALGAAAPNMPMPNMALGAAAPNMPMPNMALGAAAPNMPMPNMALGAAAPNMPMPNMALGAAAPNMPMPNMAWPNMPAFAQPVQQVNAAPVAGINPAEVLQTVRPWVDYALREAQVTGFRHAMTELGAILWLIGRGIDPDSAYRIVESWEINEAFPY